MRALTPSWRVSEAEARWIAEEQARLLLAASDITSPPVSEHIVNALEGVDVYQLSRLPAQGLLGASKPSARGGMILIDGSLPRAEQRLTLLHELKHIIDGGHAVKPHRTGAQGTGEALCTTFALSVLIPEAWLRADWQAGRRSIPRLARRYQMPATAVEQRLHTLGLQTRRRPRKPQSPRCQWHTHQTTSSNDGGTEHVA